MHGMPDCCATDPAVWSAQALVTAYSSWRLSAPSEMLHWQGESSTGTHQNLAGVGEMCKANGTLLLVDTVCSLGGVPMFADAWAVDAIYSGSQKCLAGPPGTSLSFFFLVISFVSPLQQGIFADWSSPVALCLVLPGWVLSCSNGWSCWGATQPCTAMHSHAQLWAVEEPDPPADWAPRWQGAAECSIAPATCKCVTMHMMHYHPTGLSVFSIQHDGQSNRG